LLPEERARRVATWSLLMVAATAAATVLAWIVGSFVQLVVFDLEEQELLYEAGAWGYVAGLLLLALIALPAVIGIVLGLHARHLGERRLGTTGVVVNTLIGTYLVLTAIGTILLG
jgi:hypothetical protein